MSYIFSIIFALAFPLYETNHKIVHPKDFQHIIANSIQKTEKAKRLIIERDFWNIKLEKTPNAYLFDEKLALVYSKLFEYTGEVKHLIKENQCYSNVVKNTTGKYKAAALLSQSSNAIKLHNFKKAFDLSVESFNHTSDNIGPSYMTFDAAMELGKFKYAEEILEMFADERSFDYLVRKVKLLDHYGDLTGAIEHMEKALLLSKNKADKNYIWALTNLGDMYGHNGQIQKSYDTFLKVLKLDPENLYVLKGIAWIAYSNDQNTELAKNLLRHISKSSKLPDVLLQLAEIEEYEGNKVAKEEYINSFLEIAQQSEYKNLFASYLIDLYLENSNTHDIAMSIAKEEVANRPTPSTYARLAYVYQKMGSTSNAENIINDHVLGQSFEPEVHFYSGMVLSKLGCQNEALEQLSLALDAKYELGPLVKKEITSEIEIVKSEMSSRNGILKNFF